MTVIRQRIEVPVPRKSASSTAHEKGLERFYATLYASFLRHIPFSSPSLRAIVIASPGWVRDSVMDYIIKEATRTGNKALLSARNKFIRVHITSPHVHSLVEVLKSPEVRCLYCSVCVALSADSLISDSCSIKGDQICPGRHHARQASPDCYAWPGVPLNFIDSGFSRCSALTKCEHGTVLIMLSWPLTAEPSAHCLSPMSYFGEWFGLRDDNRPMTCTQGE